VGPEIGDPNIFRNWQWIDDVSSFSMGFPILGNPHIMSVFREFYYMVTSMMIYEEIHWIWMIKSLVN
jgi:hypothetical protein